jgi:hypothetical protein
MSEGMHGHWETVDVGDGSASYWVEDPMPAPIPETFAVIRDSSDRFGRDMNGDWRVGGVNDVGGFLPGQTWTDVGYTGPLLENYGSGSGDSSEVRTSSELLAWMRDGGYQLGQGYEADTGLTVDQLFKGTETIGDPYKFQYEDKAFGIAALAAGAVVTWAAVAAAGAGAGAGAVAADAGIATAGEAYAAELAAAEAFAGASTAGITASGAAAEAYAGQAAAAEAFSAGVVDAGIVTAGEAYAGQAAAAEAVAAAAPAASTLASTASTVSSIVDTIGNAAGAVLKAAGSVLAPVAAKVLGDKLDKEFAPDTTHTAATYQPFSQAAPGAQLFPLLLIAGAVVLAYVALRK